MKDLFGQAIYDYHFNQNPEDLITETSISDLRSEWKTWRSRE